MVSGWTNWAIVGLIVAVNIALAWRVGRTPFVRLGLSLAYSLVVLGVGFGSLAIFLGLARLINPSLMDTLRLWWLPVTGFGWLCSATLVWLRLRKFN